jgi:4-hydroxy-tetrahydrodipicolinate reductase
VRYKVVQYGCGAIGRSIVKLALQKAVINIIGAIDLVNVGLNLGEVAHCKSKLGVLISDKADQVLAATKPDIVLHSTSSSLEVIYPQLEQIIRASSNVVSTCEELAYPYRKQPALSVKIDKLAKEHGVSVLGTGINPGFVMDTWPLAMTAVSQEVTHIRAVRIQDASTRRIPFQKKIGAGKTIAEFNELVEAGTLRHVGLAESIALIADGLGWELDDITEAIEPIIAQAEVRSDVGLIKPGKAAGVKQLAQGWKNGKELIALDFQAYINAGESYDAVYVTGKPPMKVVIKGGTHGDLATAAMVVNSVPRVMDAPPGLLTMKDLPIVCAGTT